jgi:thiol-disulfide isomerase/thioredoxin
MKMRRVLGLSLCLAACEGGSAPAPAPEAARVVAVAAVKNQASESDLCDVLKAPDNAPAFTYPAIEGTASAQAGGWRWINVWATWCPPCIEELPLITRFRSELGTQGTQVTLELLSVDLNAEVVQKFAETHAQAKGSLRVSDPSALESWLVSLGLDAGATLPIHIFVDPAGKVRCARTGAVRESDLPLIKKLVSAR